MNELTQHIYSDAKIHGLEQWKTKNVLDCIKDIASEMGLHVYFFNYSSELNNLGGTWGIFLNQQQNTQQIWQDFGQAVGAYISYQLSADNGENNHMQDFHYYFCVPTFLLEELMSLLTLDNRKRDPDWIISEVSKVFHVEPSFAKKRLELYSVSI
ncbi:hypothetical protein [Pseudobacillus badius]|uniref:hypothetical protein n=1 Tax=Bacillus badius TaxID=1455 RepID=UPI001CBBEB21|nr:hypothetical protein [Bacillus badius]UAT28932.1 hypothetical protein K7T73_09795 [Bacillus badius]GLY12689.1 hypothetical protein Bbad01_39050 [Bacillus badius]